MEPISAGDLNRALDESWPHGAVESVTAASRIGEDFGFGGTVHKLSVETTSGPATLLAKTETPDQVGRVVGAYSLMADVLESRVPRLYGHTQTVTLFEEVAPAAQGDGLDVRPSQVTKMVELLAELHASTSAASEISWSPEPWTDLHWEDRVNRARSRYPVQLDEAMLRRMSRLHAEVPASIEMLRSGHQALIHMDSGYDNTLWRPDGSIVLLDWSNARVGPCGYDVATHIVETDPDHVLTTYLDTAHRQGLDLGFADLTREVAAGAKILARGMLGFAGLPEEPTQPRLLQFRDRALDFVTSLLDWTDAVDRDPRFPI